MGLRATIRRMLEDRSIDRTVADVRLGLGYTAVRLDNDCAGVAYTFRDAGFTGCSAFNGVRPLAGRPAGELLEYLDSPGKIESTLGLAAANALANSRPAVASSGDVLDAVEILPSDRVGMVGFFGPLVPVLKKRVQALEIFEETIEPGTGLLPASEAFSRLPDCDVALITSTTIINDTIDRLLDAASRCRETVLLGSSTPLLPEAFRDTPVTCLSGITIDDPAGILQVVSEGGGTRFFKPFVTKWNLRPKESG